jgi:phosphate transport system substrate-binding protein
MRATITDSDDPNAYPISLFTWVLVYKNQDYDNRSMEEAEDIVKLLNYVISPEGQKVAAQINYAPLSEQALEKNRKLIDQINYSGLSITP